MDAGAQGRRSRRRHGQGGQALLRAGGGAGQVLAGLFAGTPEAAWDEASDLSRAIHITLKEKPFHTVLSCAPPMYDELWVARQMHVQARTGASPTAAN